MKSKIYTLENIEVAKEAMKAYPHLTLTVRVKYMMVRTNLTEVECEKILKSLEVEQ